eukprot:5817951-Amphidinium_carterae.1
MGSDRTTTHQPDQGSSWQASGGLSAGVAQGLCRHLGRCLCVSGADVVREDFDSTRVQYEFEFTVGEGYQTVRMPFVAFKAVRLVLSGLLREEAKCCGQRSTDTCPFVRTPKNTPKNKMPKNEVKQMVKNGKND